MVEITYADKCHNFPFVETPYPEWVQIGSRVKLLIAEPMDKKFYRACFAEFVALTLFVVMCCGCAMAVLAQPEKNIFAVALSFGFGILVLAQFIGPISGAHINNAVTFGLWVGGRVSFYRLVMYNFSQMLGATFGGLLLMAIFGTNWPVAGLASNSWDPDQFSGNQVFVAEVIGTMLLMYNVFATIDIPTVGGGPLGVMPIAMSVLVAHTFLVPITGCSINPARSFGTAFASALGGMGGRFHEQLYMFQFAPFCSAALTAIIYEYAPLKPKKRDNKDDMTDAIFMADKKRGKNGELIDASDDEEEDDYADQTALPMYDDEI